MSGQKKKKNQSAAFLQPISCTEQYDWEKEFPTTESDRFQIFKMLQRKIKCPLKKKENYIYSNKLPTITKSNQNTFFF